MKSMQTLFFATAMTATLAEAALVDCQQKFCRSSNGLGGFDCWAGNGDPFACSGGRLQKRNGATIWNPFDWKTYLGYTCCVDDTPKPPPTVVPDVELPKDCRFKPERTTPEICQEGQGRGKLIDLPASTGKSWSLNECAGQARAHMATYFVYSTVGVKGKMSCAQYEEQKPADQCQKWVSPNKDLNSYELYCDSDHRHFTKEITMGWRIKQSGPVKRDYTVTVSFDKTTTDTKTASQDINNSITDKTTVVMSNTVAVGMSLDFKGIGASIDNTSSKTNTNDKTKFRENKIHKESIHAVTTALKQMSTTKTTFDCPDHPTKYKSIYQWVTEIDGIATVESANFACIYGGLEPRCVPKYCVDRQCQRCRTDDPDAAPAVVQDEGEIQALRKQVAELSTEVKMFTKGGDKQMCPVIKNLATKFCHLSL